MVYAIAAAVVLVSFVALNLYWRHASTVRNAPCPTWLAWMLELNFPAAANGRGSVVERLALAPGMRVADVGCGTGLLGQTLALHGVRADGFDISPGMLAQAALKDAYRNLREADLTASEPAATGYGAIVSSGTFTVGHLGPDSLERLLSMGRPGALCVIGINEQHFHDAGFDTCLERWVGDGRIRDLHFTMVPIYAERPDGQDRADIARVAVFRLR